MSKITSKLSQENKDYLHLLTRLISVGGKSLNFSEKGIEALFNINGEDMTDEQIKETINMFAPVKRQGSLDEIEELNRYMERSNDLAKILLKLKPDEEEDTPYLAPVYGFSAQARDLRNVDIRYFNPKHIQLMLATTFQREVPESIDMLCTSNPDTISHLYFATMQFFDGFAPHPNDRATENMWNIMYIEGLSPNEFMSQVEKDDGLDDLILMTEELIDGLDPVMKVIGTSLLETAKKERAKQQEDEEKEENKALEFIVRLHSEHIKPLLFYGNIAPSGMTALDFFEKLYIGHIEKKDELRSILKDYSEDQGYMRYDYFGSNDPIDYFARMRPENLDRCLNLFEIKNYEQILELFLDEIFKYPGIFRMNQNYYETDEQFENVARFVTASTDLIRKENDEDARYYLQKIQHYITDHHKTTIQGKKLANTMLLLNAARTVDYETLNKRLFYTKSNLESYINLGLQIAELFEERSQPLLESLMTEEHKLYDFIGLFTQTFGDLDFSYKLIDEIKDPKERLEAMEFFMNFSDERYIRDQIACDEYTIDDFLSNFNLLSTNSIKPTPFLIDELASSKNKEEMIMQWKELLSKQFNDTFNIDDKLHESLGYTQFNQLLIDSKLKEKTDFTFTWDYSSYKELLRGNKARSRLDNQIAQFEIECSAFESSYLMHYIQEIKSKADSIGKELLIIPNFSYGYIPIIPLYEDLLEQGIKIFMGAKIGSSESHYNPNVFRDELLSGIEEYIFSEKPIIIVIDGTTHILSRNDADLDGRYPDSYQGFQNTVIAINEAQGFSRKRHTYKEEEELNELRNSYQFAEFVERNSQRVFDPEHYDFGLWNTGEYPLIVRHEKKRKSVPQIFSADNINGAALIFCNVGLYDNHIPQSIKKEFEIGDLGHEPAYFDDTHHIINLQLAVSRKGITIGNEIEPLLKKAYAKYCDATNELCHSNIVGNGNGHIDFVKQDPYTSY